MHDQIMEELKALDADPSIHYNCAQKILIPFAESCGLTKEQAADLGSCFGGGMKMGSVCGAITSGLMVIGLLKLSPATQQQFISAIKSNHDGTILCSELLKKNMEAGGDRRAHCDGMIREAVELLAAYLS